METKLLSIHDDIIQDEFLFQLNQEMEDGKWMFDCTGGKPKTYPEDRHRAYRFWGITLWRREDYDMHYTNIDHFHLTKKLFGFLEFYNNRFVPNLELRVMDINCNGQTIGQNGGIHRDIWDSNFPNYSLMIMINNKWEKEWGGQFEIMESKDPNSKIAKTIEYKPGRVVFFDGSFPHRGMSPIVPSLLRKTIVLKCLQVNNPK